VIDLKFYEKFFAHRIKIAPGDTLAVKLMIHQNLDPDTGVYTNDSYEVSEVLDHIPRPTQSDLADGGM
jgi:hypothetical protein